MPFEPPLRARRVAFAPAVAVAIAFLLLLFSRMPQAFLHPQFWAEDVMFFSQQKVLGIKAIILPYAGYLHLMPRIAAFISDKLSAIYAPHVFMGVFVAGVLWTLLTIAFAATRLSLAYSLLVLLVPHSGEVYGNVTNVQWTMSAALPVILLTQTPSSRLIQLNQRVFAFVSGLTGPFAVIALPLVAYRIWRWPDRHGTWLAAILGLDALIQFAFAASALPQASGDKEPVHLIVTLADRWFGTLIHGSRSDDPLRILIIAVFGAIVLWATLSDRANRSLKTGFLVFGFGILALTWIKFLPGSSHAFDKLKAERYFYVPKIMVLWVLFTSSCATSGGRRALLAFALCAAVFPLKPSPISWWSRGPLKAPPWEKEAQKIDLGQEANLVVAPNKAWRATVPANAEQLRYLNCSGIASAVGLCGL